MMIIPFTYAQDQSILLNQTQLQSDINEWCQKLGYAPSEYLHYKNGSIYYDYDSINNTYIYPIYCIKAEGLKAELAGIIEVRPTYREPTQVEKVGRLRDIVATEIGPGLLGLYVGIKIIRRVFKMKGK